MSGNTAIESARADKDMFNSRFQHETAKRTASLGDSNVW